MCTVGFELVEHAGPLSQYADYVIEYGGLSIDLEQISGDGEVPVINASRVGSVASIQLSQNLYVSSSLKLHIHIFLIEEQL